MAEYNSQGSLDRQYLKAMGIDLWVDRNSVLDTSEHASPAIRSSVAASSGGVQQKSLTEMSASGLAAALVGLKVRCNEPMRRADLLVITDSSSLSDECGKLLDSMFKAIEVERSAWMHASITAEDSAQSIALLENSVEPKAVLLMLKTGGDPAGLASLRGKRHQSEGLQSFTVVSFHPQDLLDNPATKRPAWEDLKQLRHWLG